MHPRSIGRLFPLVVGLIVAGLLAAFIAIAPSYASSVGVVTKISLAREDKETTAPTVGINVMTMSFDIDTTGKDVAPGDTFTIQIPPELKVISDSGSSTLNFSMLNDDKVPVVDCSVPAGEGVSMTCTFGEYARDHHSIIGHGTVGGALIGQLIEQREQLREQKHIDLRIFAIADSRHLLLDAEGIGLGWEERLEECAQEGLLEEQLVDYGQSHALENMILVDNTASSYIASLYPFFASYGFDIVSSNKRSNIAPYADYLYLRQTLQLHRRSYRYETNVGAGLPLIDNLKLLHLAGEQITRIHGLFSGSLSYSL